MNYGLAALELLFARLNAQDLCRGRQEDSVLIQLDQPESPLPLLPA
jgi:hypothetical protein